MRQILVHCLMASALLARPLPAHAESHVQLEFASGSKLEGTLIEREATAITVQVKLGSREFVRRIPLDRLRRLTIDGQTQELGAAADAPAGAAKKGTAAASGQRSRAEIKALIVQAGRTLPDWWNSTPLNIPSTLDLSWPEKPPGKWDAQRNVGQYVWDVINPNPHKWREGIRLMHHLLELHAQDPARRYRAMTQLGGMYHNLLQDYGRAAYWWEQAGVDRAAQSPPQVIELAHSYWRLGSKPMALEVLQRAPLYFSAIKLLSDMGDTQRAVQLAESSARGDAPDLAYLYAGDACRLAGQYAQAAKYYRQVLTVPPEGRAQKRIERSHQRAGECLEGIRIVDALDLRSVPDGVYRGVSPGYAGDLHVEVTVRDGRLAEVRVTNHQEKQFYAALTETPAKILARQGLKGIDTTTGATITSEAIINATAKALSRAAK